MSIKDSWTTESPEYSEDEFYTRSKDKQGHSTLYHVKVPDDLAGALSAIVQSGKIPAYRTAQDIFRDAIVHRLHWLSENIERIESLPEIQETLARITFDDRLSKYEEELKHYDELIKKIDSVCSMAIESKDFDYLHKYIRDQEEKLEVYREPFRTKIKEILQRYYEKTR